MVYGFNHVRLTILGYIYYLIIERSPFLLKVLILMFVVLKIKIKVEWIN